MSSLIAVIRSRAAVVPLVAALALPASASATSHGTLHGRVPARERAIFHAFKRPAVRSLPKRVRRAIARAAQFEATGADPTQARQVGTAEHPLYLVPGTEGICLILDNGSICSSDLGHVAAYGLGVDVVHATTNPDGTTNQFGDVVAVGVAPDGYDAVSVTTLAGATASGAIVNNSYRVPTNGPIVSRELTGPAVSPITW